MNYLQQLAKRRQKKGKWYIVHPTDCFTALPVYQCSNCKKLTDGYYPDKECSNCGCINEVDKHKSVTMPIMEKLFGNQ